LRRLVMLRQCLCDRLCFYKVQLQRVLYTVKLFALFVGCFYLWVLALGGRTVLTPCEI
jgi:hypothetical protein